MRFQFTPCHIVLFLHFQYRNRNAIEYRKLPIQIPFPRQRRKKTKLLSHTRMWGKAQYMNMKNNKISVFLSFILNWKKFRPPFLFAVSLSTLKLSLHPQQKWIQNSIRKNSRLWFFCCSKFLTYSWHSAVNPMKIVFLL